MDMVLDLLTAFFLIIGIAFTVISAIGLMRMPDFYTRMHAAGIGDTMGAGMILVGLMFQADGNWIVIVKLALIFIFIEVASPSSTHALAKGAFTTGVKPVGEDQTGSQDGQATTTREQG